MRTLHEIPVEIRFALWWRGPGFPCQDDRHDSYPEDREYYGEHHECLRAEQEIPEEEGVYFCECNTCYNAHRNHRHYFHTEDRNPLSYSCGDCREQNHPPLPEING